MIGTYNSTDTLSYKLGVKDYGIDNLAKQIVESLNALNQELDENVSQLAWKTENAVAVYGMSYGSEKGVEVDEFGNASAVKSIEYAEVAFPLKRYAFAAGWTNEFIQNATAGQMLGIHNKIQIEYQQRVLLELKKAIYNNTNYSVKDPITNTTLAVKRFLNADGDVIPNSVYGDTFTGSTHTHYVAKANATLAASDIDGLITHVTEHGNTHNVKIYIANADRGLLAAISGGKFMPLSLSVLAYSGENYTKETRSGPTMDNQLIGYWDAVEVWTKPMGIHNYLLCVDTGSPEKPLGYRVPERNAGLHLESKFEPYPLVADNYKVQFGFGVLNRTAGAVLYVGNTTWANPTIS